MLSMSAMSGGQASYYLGLAREDYYLEGGEPPGQWYGEGASKLGLHGEVEAAHIYNLFGGYSPEGDRPLVQLQSHDEKATHRPGWDLTFSAPKSVSALWSQLGPEDRQALQAAHFEAVTRALDYLQETAALTRRGRGGNDLERTGLVIATFEHSTSRALDPQLHTHALVLNVGVREDGTTGTVSSLSLFQAKMAAGALYRAHLSAFLERNLAIQTEAYRAWFEVVGVPEELIAEFSKRREAIEAELDRRGLDTAEAASVAAIGTREAKPAVARSELFQEWRTAGRGLGWSTEEAVQLVGHQLPERDPEQEAARALSHASNALTQSQAHFTERDFVRHVAEASQASGLFAEDILEHSRAHLRYSPEIVRLGRHYGEERFTTKQMMELEKRLLASVENLDADDYHQVGADRVVEGLGRHHELSEEQMNAVLHITGGTGGFAAVSGMAGTGKTRMLEAAQHIWESDGKHVVGAALAARAVKELEEGAEIESSTIARLLYLAEKGRLPLTKESVLVVDEAGMVATSDLQRLAALCESSGSKLVLIGDEKQLQPIGPGAPFMELGQRFGQAEMKDIRRQDDAWARRAVKDLAEGRAQEALEAFVSRGLVKVTETRQEAMAELVKDWRADAKPSRDTLLLAGTRADVQELNALAQRARLEAGELGDAHVDIAGANFHVGDRVMFTKKHPVLGVVNGDRGFLHSVDDRTRVASVMLDSGEKVSFPVDAMEHIVLGYASTTHKGQGATTLRTYVLAGGSMQDREMSYVQASRAREQTTFYMTRVETGDELAKLAREMERSRQKEMAHTILREQEQKNSHHEQRRRQ